MQHVPEYHSYSFSHLTSQIMGFDWRLRSLLKWFAKLHFCKIDVGTTGLHWKWYWHLSWHARWLCWDPKLFMHDLQWNLVKFDLSPYPKIEPWTWVISVPLLLSRLMVFLASLSKVSPTGKGRWSFPFTQHCWDTYGVLDPVWCFPVQNTHRLIGVSATMGDRDSYKIGASVIWRKAESLDHVSLREEKAQGDLISEYKCPMRGSNEDKASHLSGAQW